MEPSSDPKLSAADSKNVAQDGNNTPVQAAQNPNSGSVQNLSAAERTVVGDSPEVDRVLEDIEKRRAGKAKIIRMVMTASTVIGAAVPLLMFKNSEGWQKWAKRGATAIVTGGAAGILGGMVSSAMLIGGDRKKYEELNRVENDVVHRYRAFEKVKDLSAGVTPRDTSHAAQVAKESSQQGTPTLGA